MLLSTRMFILLALVDISVALVPNVTNIDEVKNDLGVVETRRRGNRKRGKKYRSTSSEETRLVRRSSTSGDDESLELSSHDTSTSSSEEKRTPKSSMERRGWRKWHRKCESCPEDMAKKWRDPTIKWLCGGYQRARRSFKSECMMHYRNCQDGTMFVKIHDHRCANDTARDGIRRGIHFFYDYKAHLSDDSTRSISSSSGSDSSSSGDW
ncbi:uncharacterized protein LOC120633908 [Pararge aegeria]|uniref:uncharacterized protein LOC120633908 n=1 Tax=Pararge aegeria TaxID=116150 RepID=UPI0019D17B74|nr:uncharacterized protein LOC120633908 [Pararge aegeria]